MVEENELHFRDVRNNKPKVKYSHQTKIHSKEDKEIEQYIHKNKKRPYNPPVGLVTQKTDEYTPRKEYLYDPHLDPQLNWTGKKENESFDVDTISLHVHERIDPLTIIEKILKKDDEVQKTLFYYFEIPDNNPPLREAIKFYKHSQNWSNRLIAGDSLLVMNSLLTKEGFEGKVQMIYIDPPYGIKYASNFQPFINKRNVQDGKDEDLTLEPEMIKAFRDTWELGIHSYLNYLRERLLLSHSLLDETGSCFVQIGEENVHLVRCIMDEIFKSDNFISQISVFKTTTPRSLLDNNLFYLLWYAKNKSKVKYHQLYINKPLDQWTRDTKGGSWGVTIDGKDRPLKPLEKYDVNLLPPGSEVYQLSGLTSSGASTDNPPFQFNNKDYYSGEKDHWKTSVEGLNYLAKLGRIEVREGKPWFKKYHKDFPYKRLTNVWSDTSGKATERIYVVQTQDKVIERCLLMTTDPGDLVFDPTCGSGTTAYSAEKGGRRWITCDTSRIAVSLAKKRLMTAKYNYYTLKNPNEGISNGFKYETSPHVTLASLAKEEESKEEILYDQPLIDKSKIRISGPFTVEAVPAPVVKDLDQKEEEKKYDGLSLSKVGETLRQEEWRREILRTGIKIKGRDKIEFSRVEPLQVTKWLHAEGEIKEDKSKRVVISFGQEYYPLEQRQVELALQESQMLVPRPEIIIFVAFEFDPEAAKDIDETDFPGVSMLKVKMNPDLLTKGLKKQSSTNESFWLIGQPDIELIKQKNNMYSVEIHGFDYYNVKNGKIESGDTSKIAMWMLDTDYDGRSLYPQQVFFPMDGKNNIWKKLVNTLKSQINEKLIDKYIGTISLPFSVGKNKRIAVKIIDDRGIESLKILEIE